MKIALLLFFSTLLLLTSCGKPAHIYNEIYTTKDMKKRPLHLIMLRTQDVRRVPPSTIHNIGIDKDEVKINLTVNINDLSYDLLEEKVQAFTFSKKYFEKDSLGKENIERKTIAMDKTVNSSTKAERMFTVHLPTKEYIEKNFDEKPIFIMFGNPIFDSEASMKEQEATYRSDGIYTPASSSASIDMTFTMNYLIWDSATNEKIACGYGKSSMDESSHHFFSKGARATFNNKDFQKIISDVINEIIEESRL